MPRNGLETPVWSAEDSEALCERGEGDQDSYGGRDLPPDIGLFTIELSALLSFST